MHTRKTVLTGALTSLALIAQLFFPALIDGLASQAFAAEPVVVKATTPGWSITTHAGGEVEFLPEGSAPLGTGALRFRTTPSVPTEAKITTPQNVLLSAVTSMSYKTKQEAGTFSLGNPRYLLGVDINSDNIQDGYFVYDTQYNPAPTGTGWISWNVFTGQFWSTLPVGVLGANPGGSLAKNFSVAQALAEYPLARVLSIGLDKAPNNPNWLAYADAFEFSGTTYDFEPGDSYEYSESDSAFLTGVRYVRAGNASDIAAQVRVPAATEEVEIVFAGSAEVLGVATEHFQAGQWPNSLGQRQFRGRAALTPGEHTVQAQYRVEGVWYPVPGSALVYAIDAPTASYVLPSESSAIFRPSDNPVRVKAEDEFMQFDRMAVTVNSATHIVYRSACDLREEGNYVLCDVDASTTWTDLPEGTYTASTTTYTKAGNRVDNLLSLPFQIDGTKPGIIDFSAPATSASPLLLSAMAIDDVAVESVNFYVTAPRPTDAVCDGNGTKLAELRVFTPGLDGRYTASLDVSGLNGKHCAVAVARDTAFNNSALEKRGVIIDTEAPGAPVITTPSPEQYFATTPILNEWTAVEDPSGIDKYQVEYIYDDGHTFAGGPYRDVPGTQTYRNHVPAISEQGGVTIRVRAIDGLGNVGVWSAPVHYTYDATAPAAVNLVSPANGAVVPGALVTQAWEPSTSSDVQYYIYQSYHDAAATNIRWTQTVSGTSKSATNVADATFWWRVRVVDYAGNMSDWSPLWKLVVDSTAPDTLITAPGSEAIIGGTVEITGTITEANILRYYFFVADELGNMVYGPFTVYDQNNVSYLWNTQLVPDGRYKIQLEARDKANNKDAGSVDMIWVTVDNSVGASTILTPAELPIQTASPVSVTWSAASTAHGIDYYELEYTYLDGETPMTSSFTSSVEEYDLLVPEGAQGEMTLRVRAFDVFGNIGEWSDLALFEYDSIAPTVPTNGLPSNQLLAVNDVNFSWDASTDENSIVYEFQASQDPSADAGVLTDPARLLVTGLVDPSALLSDVADGPWYWQVRAIDAAGNVSSWSEVWELEVDTTLPLVSITAPLASATLSGSVAITGLITEINPSEYTVSVINSASAVVFASTVVSSATSINVPWNTLSVADGAYTISAVAKDLAGNSSALASVAITVLNTPPAVSGIGGNPGADTPPPAPTTPAPVLAPVAPAPPAPAPTEEAVIPVDEAPVEEDQTLAAQGNLGEEAESGEVAGAQDSAGATNRWYWWLLLIPAFFILWLIAARRRSQEEDR